MFDFIERNVITSMRLKPASAQEHGALLKALEDLAGKAGMSTPNLYVWKSAELNAGAFSPKSLFVSDGLIETLGHKGNPNVVTKEIKAILAHELSHVQNYKSQYYGRVFPKYVGPLAGLIACKLISDEMGRHKDRKKALETITTKEDHDILAIDESSYEHLLPDERAGLHTWRKQLATAAKYLAAAGIGWGVGMVIRDRLHFQYEYLADGLGAKLVGKGAMISALRKVEAKTKFLINHFLKDIPDKETAEAIKKVGKMIGRIKMPHPSLEQRVSHINSLHL